MSMDIHGWDPRATWFAPTGPTGAQPAESQPRPHWHPEEDLVPPGPDEAQYAPIDQRIPPLPPPPRPAEDAPADQFAVYSLPPTQECRQALGFPCHSVIIDNLSDQWLWFPSTRRYVAPWTTGAIHAFMQSTQVAWYVAQAPVGQAANPAPNAGHVITTIWLAGYNAPSAGTSYPPTTTPSRVSIWNTAGTGATGLLSGGLTTYDVSGDITAAVMPAGGSGLRGWVSAVYNQLLNGTSGVQAQALPIGGSQTAAGSVTSPAAGANIATLTPGVGLYRIMSRVGFGSTADSPTNWRLAVGAATYPLLAAPAANGGYTTTTLERVNVAAGTAVSVQAVAAGLIGSVYLASLELNNVA